MTRRLRQGHGHNGLILANGGVMTYQHVLCLSTTPRKNNSMYPTENPLPELITDIPVPKIEEFVEGNQEAVIETYTVEFARDNTPLRAYIVGRLGNGARFIANHGDASTLNALASFNGGEKIGLGGRVHNDGQRNLFVLENRASKL